MWLIWDTNNQSNTKQSFLIKDKKLALVSLRRLQNRIRRPGGAHIFGHDPFVTNKVGVSKHFQKFGIYPSNMLNSTFWQSYSTIPHEKLPCVSHPFWDTPKSLYKLCASSSRDQQQMAFSFRAKACKDPIESQKESLYIYICVYIYDWHFMANSRARINHVPSISWGFHVQLLQLVESIWGALHHVVIVREQQDL